MVRLPPKFVATGDGDERKVTAIERTPGTSEHVTINWPPYFKATPQDVSADVDAASKARAVTISNRTAVKYTAHHFGVKDVDAELDDIEAEKEVALQRMVESAPPPGGFGFDGERNKPDGEENKPGKGGDTDGEKTAKD